MGSGGIRGDSLFGLGTRPHMAGPQAVSSLRTSGCEPACHAILAVPIMAATELLDRCAPVLPSRNRSNQRLNQPQTAHAPTRRSLGKPGRSASRLRVAGRASGDVGLRYDPTQRRRVAGRAIGDLGFDTTPDPAATGRGASIWGIWASPSPATPPLRVAARAFRDSRDQALVGSGSGGFCQGTAPRARTFASS